MISRRRLDRLEAVFNPPEDAGSRERELRRAEAAWEAGNWTWDDARLLFGERAKEWRAFLYTNTRRTRTRVNRTSGSPCPLTWANHILTYRPDEEVPSELSANIMAAAFTIDPKPWIDQLQCDRAEAVVMMLVLETADAMHFRRRIWDEAPYPFPP